MKNLAQNIASEYSEKNGVSCSIDPLLLVSIAQILIDTFRLVKYCQKTKSKEKIEQMCFQPNGMQKILLRRIVRKHVDQNTELTNGLMDVIIKQGGSLSPNSLWEIINEQVQDD